MPREEINEVAARKRQWAKIYRALLKFMSSSFCLCVFYVVWWQPRWAIDSVPMPLTQCRRVSTGNRARKKLIIKKKYIQKWKCTLRPVEEGSTFLTLSPEHGKKNVKSSHLRCWLEWWRHGRVRSRSPCVSSCPRACTCSCAHIFYQQ